VRGIIVDITQRKEMEQRLLKAQQLATIGETAAMVGHDLRNPLQGIEGAVNCLKMLESERLSEQGKELLQLIEDEIRRSDKIITDLVEYSAPMGLETSPSNAKSLVEAALASVKIPENIRVVNHAREQHEIEVDVDKIKRALLNLIRNAIDAMPNGGTLTIESAESSDSIQVDVIDTGEGMSEDILRKIWSPLFTTKAKGMGYGLAIVKRYVEAHGGSVHVETCPRKGSTFTITLPLQTVQGKSRIVQRTTDA
jgi:signal transduction histidine kinase